MTESQESFLGAVSTSQPSQESFRGGSDAGGGIDSAAFLQQDNDKDKDNDKDNDNDARGGETRHGMDQSQ